MSLIAHVVTGGPEGLLWPSSLAMFGGLVAAVAWPCRRKVASVIAVAGLAATVVLYATWPSAPLAPAGLSLRIAAPTTALHATSPLTVQVCTNQGPAPGTGRLLSVSVDGRQMVESTHAAVAVSLATGHHDVEVQLVTGDHRAFAPPVAATESVIVTGAGPLGSVPGCGR